jgi:uncharacterized protein YjiS (DUF1127 family)
MSTMSLDLTVRSSGRSWSSGLRLSEIKRQLAVWWHNIRSRAELETLDDRCLQDIGLTRCAADFEAAKPFWVA